MKITVIAADNIVIVDGDTRRLEPGTEYPEGLTAIQWDGASGKLEYSDRGQEHSEDMGVIQPFIDLHAGKKLLDETPPVYTLAELKAKKVAEINAARLAANFTTFNHASKTFACDQLSRSDIDGTNGTITLTGDFPPGWPGGWKAVDNTYIAITTRAHWEAFYLSMCGTGAVNFGHAQALKATLAAATTAEQVAAITW